VPDIGPLAECVINISEGRDRQTIDALCAAGAGTLLDLHCDPEHHRSVLTLAGPLGIVEGDARQVVASAVALIDLRSHHGIHPRLGAADVVPFVPLVGDASGWARALDARDRFARWAGTELQVPCFLYGPERSLPDVRRLAFHPLRPDSGPGTPHPTAGASAVGVRNVLVAYNIWIAQDGAANAGPGDQTTSALTVARSLATALRGPGIRSLGLPVDMGAQVSFNLIEPTSSTMVEVFDAVAAGAALRGCPVIRAELVGLIPATVLHGIPRHRWAELDLSDEQTIEARLTEPGLRTSALPRSD
jgi:glutamate formiminotransferase / 5-formyltetrahydrofolate cyclo-ligase